MKIVLVILAVVLWSGITHAIELSLEPMGTDTETTRRLENMRDWNPKYEDYEIKVYHEYEKLLSEVKTEKMYSYQDWRILGIANWLNEDFNKSVDCFRKALEKSTNDESSVRIGLWLSRALFKSQKYVEAIQIDNILRPYEFKEDANK